MKRFTLVFLVLAMGLVTGFLVSVKANAGCLATEAQCADAWSLKKEAIAYRDKGQLDLAAEKYETAAMKHPQEAYQASYLLNAEGCLVGKWNASKGYRYDKTKGDLNKTKALALLAQVRTTLDKVKADNCVYKKGLIEGYEIWYSNALDALNGIFH
jgi:hypothetical protein